jgi:hypothetical protein
MPLVSAVTWAFVPQRLASSAGIRQPRTACRGPGQASEPRRRTLPRLSSAVRCCSPGQVDRLCPSAGVANTGSPSGEQSTRQSVQSVVREPGVGDEGGHRRLRPCQFPRIPWRLAGPCTRPSQERQGCWSRYGVEPSDRCDRRWPCSPAARTQRGPSSRRLPCEICTGPCARNCMGLRIGEVAGETPGQWLSTAGSGVMILHSLRAASLVVTDSGCCPFAARRRPALGTTV